MAAGKRIAVAHVGPTARGRGGMAAVIRMLASTALARDFELVAISTHRPGTGASRLLTFARGYGAFIRWARRPGLRVAHVHVTVRGSTARKLILVATARAHGVPVLLHVHAGAPELLGFHERLGPLGRRLVRWGFRLPDRLVAVSRASADVLDGHYGARRVEVVPNPAPRVAPVNGARAAAEVLYLGGFANPVKGADVLLAALPAVRAGTPTAQLTLAGPGEPPSSALAAVGGDPLVDLAGYLDEDAKRAALGRASVVVLPSRSEGLPMALLEAMAVGAPIIATKVGGIPEVAVDGRDAVLLDAGDSGALADAITALLNDPQHARWLGENARRRAAALSPERVADRVAAIYRGLAERS